MTMTEPLTSRCLKCGDTNKHIIIVNIVSLITKIEIGIRRYAIKKRLGGSRKLPGGENY